MLGRSIYVIGGTAGASAERYDVGLDRSTSIAPIPKGRTHAAAVAHKGRIWVVGGVTGRSTFASDVWTYDPLADRWGPGRALPEPLHGHRAVSIGDELHVLGGTADFDAFDHHWILRGDAWVRLPDAPAPWMSFAGFLSGERCLPVTTPTESSWATNSGSSGEPPTASELADTFERLALAPPPWTPRGVKGRARL